MTNDDKYAKLKSQEATKKSKTLHLRTKSAQDWRNFFSSIAN